MYEYKIKCTKCGVGFDISSDKEIPLFNESKKGSWDRVYSPSSGLVQIIVSDGKMDNLLYAIKSYHLD